MSVARGWAVPHDAMDMEFAMAFHGDEAVVGPYSRLMLKKEAAGLTDDEESCLCHLGELLLHSMVNALWAGELRARASYPGQLDKIEVPNDFWGRGVEVDRSRNTAKARNIVLEALHIYDPWLVAAEAQADATPQPPQPPSPPRGSGGDGTQAEQVGLADKPAAPLPRKKVGRPSVKGAAAEHGMLADIRAGKCSAEDLYLMGQKVLAARYGEVSLDTANRARKRVLEIVGNPISDN